MDNYIDDKAEVNKLYNSFAGRPILILAPGKSIVREIESVKSFIDKFFPVVIGVNRSSEDYKYDYLFETNENEISGKTCECW